MRDRGAYMMVQTRNHPADNLLQLREDSDGRLVARAAGNSPFGRTDSYRASSKHWIGAVDDALRTYGASGDAGKILEALDRVEVRLKQAGAKFAKTTGKGAPPKGLVVSGGLPSLGKRR